MKDPAATTFPSPEAAAAAPSDLGKSGGAGAAESKPSLAVCLITRNGTDTLRRCIDSVRPHVDEVCVYLAGESTDGTEELVHQIAGEPGCPVRIGGGPFVDFATARNESFAMASAQYLMWLDDDDEVVGGMNLRGTLTTRPDFVQIRRVLLSGGRRRVTFGFCNRIYRLTEKTVWVSPVHEVIPHVTTNTVFADPAQLLVLHRPAFTEATVDRHDHRALVERAFATAKGPLRIHLGLHLINHLMNDDEDHAAAEKLVTDLLDAYTPGGPDWSDPVLEIMIVTLLRRRAECFTALAEEALRASDKEADLHVRKFPDLQRLYVRAGVIDAQQPMDPRLMNRLDEELRREHERSAS